MKTLNSYSITSTLMSLGTEGVNIESRIKENIDPIENVPETKRVFENSTHQYLIYFAQDGYKHLNGFVLGMHGTNYLRTFNSSDL